MEEKDKETLIEELKLNLAIKDVMIISLFNTINDIIKAMSHKAKPMTFEKWAKDCEITARKILEREKKEDVKD